MQFVILFLVFLLKQGLAEVLDDVHFVQGTFSYTGQDEDEVTNPFPPVCLRKIKVKSTTLEFIVK